MFLRRKKEILEEIQCLCGLLNFACQVVLPGRTFLRRLFELTRGLEKLRHHLRLKRGCKDDLLVWKEFLHTFNGKYFFLEENFLDDATIQLYTDASGSHGYRAVFGKSWFYGAWDAEWRDINITVKDLYPIVLAVEVWGKRMANSCICFQSDNEALVYVLNKQSSKESNIMFLIRKLVLLSLNFNILFKSEHNPDKKNVLSEALSRLQIQNFLHMMPEAEKVPTSVPLLPQLPN